MKAVIDFIVGIGGLVTALATLVAAIVQLIDIIRKIKRKRKNTERRDIKEPGLFSLGIVVLCLLVTFTIISVRWIPQVFGDRIGRPIFLEKSFIAYEHSDFGTAIENADKVLGPFAGLAILEQERLEKAGVPLPPVGDVPKFQQDEIFARGVLNDVGAMFFNKAQSLEATHRSQEARQAYQDAARLTYARTYDPRPVIPIFWSSSDAATGRLRTLK